MGTLVPTGPTPTTPSLSLAISHPAFFLPQIQKMSSDNEMAISEVSTAESVFRGAAEAPKRAGARATGEENAAGQAALREQLARLEAPLGRLERATCGQSRPHLGGDGARAS